jgi:hypothetical protein
MLIGYIILLVCGIFPLHVALATSIVAIRAKEEVVVGADSKRTYADGTSVPGTICKIRKGNGLFFATAGLGEARDFNPHALIFESSRIDGTIDKKIETILISLIEPLKRALDLERKDLGLGFLRKYPTAPALQIVFFGLEKGSAFMAATEFIVPIPSLSGPVQMNIRYAKCPGNLCPEGEQMITLGEDKAIWKFLDDKPGYWKTNVGEVARELVQLEIDDIGDRVGLPISVLSVGKNGARWIGVKPPQCPDI